MDQRSLAKACSGFRPGGSDAAISAQNNSRLDLHDENSPAIKDEDVSDVAAAVFATPSSAKSALAGDPEQLTARGRESWKEVESGGIQGHLS